MELIQRLGDNINDSYINSYIEAIKKYDGSCDEVWFATKYGFPPIEKHKETAEIIKAQAEKFRAAGISVSLQLSNSIGHGAYMSTKDCSGMVFEGSKAEKLVGHDGTVADYCFCWRGENFKKYLIEELKLYASIEPNCIWIDDDFRANNHDPVSFGCFCDSCIKKFNKKHSFSFDRKTLVDEFLHGDIAIREKYIDFIREGLYLLMREIGETVHAVSPKTAIGLQYAANGSFTGHGYNFIFDAILETTKLPPRSRPGGGAYNDHNPNEFLNKAFFTNRANSMLPSYVRYKCPEIENLPFVAFGKSPAGTAFEASCYFANGNTDMSFSMIMHLNEEMKWHEKEFKLFSEQRKYWEKLSEYNKKTYQSGIHYFMSKNIHKRQLSENETMWDLSKECYDGASLLTYDAIPISFDEIDDDIILLHPENAKSLSKEEIEYLLKKDVITDGETVEILKNKGVDIGISAKKISPCDIRKLGERLSSHEANPNGFNEWTSSYFTEGRNEIYYFTSNLPLEILGTYVLKTPNTDFDDKNIAGSIAEAILTTNEGGKWALLGYAPWKGVISLNKRNQILNIADYISQNRLPARLETPIRAVLLPRKNDSGKTAMVSIINCTIGKSTELELIVRNPSSDNAVFMSQNMNETKLACSKIGNDYTIKVPSMEPWSVGTVFFV